MSDLMQKNVRVNFYLFDFLSSSVGKMNGSLSNPISISFGKPPTIFSTFQQKNPLDMKNGFYQF
jgi:hypothetical protein